MARWWILFAQSSLVFCLPDLDQGEPKGRHQKVIAALFDRRWHKCFPAVSTSSLFLTYPPAECDTQRERHGKLFWVGDARSTIVKRFIKEGCRHQVVLGSPTWPLQSKEDLWRVALLYLGEGGTLTCPLHELCCHRQTWRRKACQYVHMNIAWK